MTDNSIIFYKTIRLSGVNLDPTTLLSNLKIKCHVGFSQKKGDSVSLDHHKYLAEEGVIVFAHPQKYSISDNIDEYDLWYINLIEKHYNDFINAGVDEEDIDLHTYVYYDGSQLNFEQFSKNILKRLSKFNIDLLITVIPRTLEELDELVRPD